MAVWAIGDVQGCHECLLRLVDAIKFDDRSDQLWFVGDLVNRGPDSLGVLRFVKSLGDSAIVVLGNHDLHLLALRYATGRPNRHADLADVLLADDCDELLDWLRHKPLAHYDASVGYLMVHAGVAPSWTRKDTLRRSREVEDVLASKKCGKFLAHMYGRKPLQWHDDLAGYDRLRFITNCMTRVRFLEEDGTMDFHYKGPPGTQRSGLVPWFKFPDRRTAKTRIVFGHWSALGTVAKKRILALDSGCVWGGELTAARLTRSRKLRSVSCL